MVYSSTVKVLSQYNVRKDWQKGQVLSCWLKEYRYTHKHNIITQFKLAQRWGFWQSSATNRMQYERWHH